jgi:hypothetical protein
MPGGAGGIPGGGGGALGFSSLIFMPPLYCRDGGIQAIADKRITIVRIIS